MRRAVIKQEIQIKSNAVAIIGDLTLPENAASIIIFAHGSGSSRHSSRNRYVAEQLNGSGFATLLLDLLTAEEEKQEPFTMHYRIDIEMLADRLCSAVDWVSWNRLTENLTIGLFGASTGSAAALECAANRRDKIAALVSRGGRPDLSADVLPRILCPTLFIVGGFDPHVLALNEKALHMMSCHREIEIVPGASHLFEEAGKMDIVSSMASMWFARYCTLQFAPGLKPHEMVDGMSPSMIEHRDSIDHFGRHKTA